MSGLDEAESVQPAPAQQSLPHAGAPPQKLPRLNASGLLPPNATLTVGKFRVTVERHIGRGGHSQLYHVTFHPTLHAEKSPPPVAAANEREHTRASSPTSHDRREGALKHVRISSPDHRAAVEREIAVMLQLQGHPNIVTLYDSCVLDADGLLLMEYCPQGDVLGLINRTYPNHLKAPVVLDIFFDVCRAVAHMHYQVPLLLHRDLKVENILLSTDPDTGQTRYKLCDFGSATSHLIRAGDSSSRETIALLTEDIQKHTTLEYRAPELIDFYISREVTEKVDIWALG
ncbi:Ark- serine/threonine protein kinase, partial [Spiromyces aspiralis]